MDKKIKIGIGIGIIALIVVIALAMFNASNDITNQLSPLTDSFDYSNEPMTSWNENKKEYSFEQNISSANGNDYKDISMRVLFFKDGKSLDNYTADIDKTTNGSFKLKFNAKLSEEPDEFYYDVIKANEIQ